MVATVKESKKPDLRPILFISNAAGMELSPIPVIMSAAGSVAREADGAMSVLMIPATIVTTGGAELANTKTSDRIKTFKCIYKIR